MSAARASLTSTRRRSRRGFTILELLVAAALATGFAAIVGNALVTTSSLARQSLVKAALEQEVRQLSDRVTRSLVGAAPLGECVDPAPLYPPDQCLDIRDTNTTFLSATPTAVSFFTYALPPGQASTTAALTPPDLVSVALAGQSIEVRRFPPPADATYTNPQPVRTTSEIVAAYDTDTTTDLFRYYDSSGTRLGCSGGVTNPCVPEALPATDLQRIALIEFRPRLTRTISNEVQAAGLDILVTVAEDQS